MSYCEKPCYTSNDPGVATAHGCTWPACSIGRERPKTGNDVFKAPELEKYGRSPMLETLKSETSVPLLTTDDKARKGTPVFSGFMKYFPKAMAAVAELSRIGNDKHNPSQPLHWSKDKSNDHADCIARHQLEAGTIDTDGVRHSTKVAWRAMAQLEIELEEACERGYRSISGFTKTRGREA